ncbi:MAG: T9SS type A sorting domain-containing protein [Ignavibacteriae bacterium]|jgi:hypothetical protein|nr:T9SS C-terminal target domain-containing protein [Ignavibacteriota bacterium]NOG96600.1 T9SS type A sorting domain-containing protein [Ignavibacteriota bacterium]
MKLLRTIALLLSSAAILFAQTSEPIVNIRTNDLTGMPTRLGEVVTISGIVTASNQFGNSGPANIQDITAGISIYGSSFANAVSIGDSVTVTATVDQFNGLTQLNMTMGSPSFTNHGAAVEEVDPTIVTLSDILNQDWNGTELIEGLLVRVNNVSINGSGTFSGSANYTITDPTGSLDMRIDNDVASIIGTAIPSGTVDLIGVVGQYDFGVLNSGYQILPRFIEDIVTENTPLILTPVVASNVTPNSFTVYYNTLRNGDSEVRYGVTAALELDTIKIAEDTTVHVIPISGLEELTKYYYKVYSTNEVGTSESDIFSVTTASSNPSIGGINVYFNYSVDNSVAIPGNEAQGNIDFRDKLIERINAATYSIDMAVYSFFGLNDVANTIVAAKNRGVKVRVVYDARNVQSSMQILLDNGIQMSQRPSWLNGIMHNKFAIFDARDSVATNDWVWTGSWNWTSLELNWRNNIVEINDPSLAQTYQEEFEEMWGSDTDTPNSSNAKFGFEKTDNTSHSFSIGGRDVGLYFSPSDQTESKIINAIASADSSIYFALLAFTSDGIFNSIEQRHSLGVTDIRGIITDANIQGSEFANLQNLSGSEVFDFNFSDKLHHKYGMVDAPYASTDPTVITGSHNWSRAANESNDENTLIIHDVYIANQYMQEFKKRYNELGGTTVFNIPVLTSVDDDAIIPSKLVLEQNYPNPFNPVTTISFTLPASEYVDLSVYNLLGQKVAVVYSGVANSGKTVVDFNASALSSGIYFYTLSTQSDSFTKKLMLLK